MATGMATGMATDRPLIGHWESSHGKPSGETGLDWPLGIVAREAERRDAGRREERLSGEARPAEGNTVAIEHGLQYRSVVTQTGSGGNIDRTTRRLEPRRPVFWNVPVQQYSPRQVRRRNQPLLLGVERCANRRDGLIGKLLG